MEDEGYTPGRVKAILRRPDDYSVEERVDVFAAVQGMGLLGDVGARVLYLWSRGHSQAESLRALGVKGDASRIFRRALAEVAERLNGHEVGSTHRRSRKRQIDGGTGSQG